MQNMLELSSKEGNWSILTKGLANAMDCNSAMETSNVSSCNYYNTSQTEDQTQTSQYVNQSAVDSSSSVSATPGIPSGNTYDGSYSGYNSYPGVYNHYPYGSTSYPGYNYGYSEQGNHSYSHHVGAYQNSGAPYTDSTHYPTTATYYNPGVYQSMEGYRSTGYNSQTPSWNDPGYGNYGGYSGYPGYGTVGPYPSQSHDYQSWQEYYKQSETDVSCAPGTEPTVVSSAGNTQSLNCSVQQVNAEVAQPPPPGTQPSWQPNANSYYDASLQQAQYGYFQRPSFAQSHQFKQPQEQKPLPSQLQMGQTSTSLPVSQHVSSSTPTVSTNDCTQKSGKLQIPTNPRITSTLGIGVSDAVRRKTNAAVPVSVQKPAYTKVNAKVLQPKPPSGDAADVTNKQETFPPSLFHYVERALARCKDEAQKAACQNIMKEIIVKASDDGSLFSKNWDTEPLFPLPSANVGSIMNIHNPVAPGSMSKSEHSQVKRSKSRWEPLDEEKLNKQPMVPHGFVKGGIWEPFKEGQSKVSQSNGLQSNMEQSQTQEPSRLSKKARIEVIGDIVSEIEEESGNSVLHMGSTGYNEALEERKKRESRSRRFNNVGTPKAKAPGVMASKSASHIRTDNSLLLSKMYIDGSGSEVEDIGWDSQTIKGTCQEIEKRYLRLTSTPDPNTVRPEEVLHEALTMVENSSKNYLYKCDQLKSIRQDLTVQRIRNEFTVKVYETHARLALEAGDLSEYNQCQSQLEGLYAEGIEGCNYEFLGYKLLYSCLNSGNSRDLLSSMARLSKEAKENDIVKHALSVRAAVSLLNYTAFFRLYKSAPLLSASLMDLYVEKMRFEAIRCISRAYRPTVPVSFIAETLGFTDIDGVDACEEWLKAHGAVLVTENSTGEVLLRAKESTICLFMPDPEDAVSHGDATLAVDNFLTRG
eukprot:TRINITY_DN4645_c0_g1_i4.p1 TRINITY_DN4645_c0_g1~~TRINITY_DN4645_c0_g1_i4.p1  ORF type:complete len:920 (+),score=183.14 TRINITY_DN4645_c0_g1_i4:460-3219(+)